VEQQRSNGLFHRLRRMTSISGGSSTKKKLLILMSDTGGGHRASAQAIDQALQDQYPGRIDVKIMDIWTEHAKWPFNRFVPMYRFLAKHPLLWRGFYAYGLFPPTKLFTELDSQRVCYKGFKKAIEAADPDFVVSVHPLCQLMPISIIREMNKKRVNKPRIPFVTVVTDLGSAHTCWFDRRADAVYVPSLAVRDIALRNYIPANKILMKGLPIRPKFWQPAAPKALLRRAMGIASDAKTVLLMGGGDGVGGLDNIATEIAAKLKTLDFRTQLLVVCGHNQKIKEQLTQRLVTSAARTADGSGNSGGGVGGSGGPEGVWAALTSPLRLVNRLGQTRSSASLGGCALLADSSGPPKPTASKLKVSVQGFVQNVDELMGAADLLVTKAGPGTIAEAMTRGLPLVLSSYLPGQVRIRCW
jgi:1,2-diacylglycerol 3-beta-galactosyltransferase